MLALLQAKEKSIQTVSTPVLKELFDKAH